MRSGYVMTWDDIWTGTEIEMDQLTCPLLAYSSRVQRVSNAGSQKEKAIPIPRAASPANDNVRRETDRSLVELVVRRHKFFDVPYAPTRCA
jgi:hypothetical protein